MASNSSTRCCRADTTYDAEAGVLTISHTPKADAMQVAYFAPYTYDRHTQLVAEMQVRVDKGVARDLGLLVGPKLTSIRAFSFAAC